MSWLGGAEIMHAITCVPLIPSHLVLGLISKPQGFWLSLASREIFLARREKRKDHLLSTYYVPWVCLPGNHRGLPLLSYFTDEETEVPDAEANSWQSWELNRVRSGYKAVFTKTCCFSTVEKLIVFSLFSHHSFWFLNQNIRSVRAVAQPLLTN